MKDYRPLETAARNAQTTVATLIEFGTAGWIDVVSKDGAVCIHRVFSFLFFGGVLNWLSTPDSLVFHFDLGDLLLFNIAPLTFCALLTALIGDVFILLFQRNRRLTLPQ